VEQPTRLELQVNLKAAKALGLTIPDGILVRADRMRRRTFIAALGGVAAWPMVARAQQAERMRRVGVLIGYAETDPVAQARVKAFQENLQQLGWIDGRDVRIDYRWTAGTVENARKYAAELLALAPDVIPAVGGTTGPMLQATRTVPIVFANTSDPVGSGFVNSLSRPGGNATGFTPFEFSLCAKWVELLKQIAPGMTRAAVIRDPTIASGPAQFAVIQSVAPSNGVEVSPINLTADADEIEQSVTTFARAANGGLIVTGPR
jgi:putative ABC transport system substrate-binding protein